MVVTSNVKTCFITAPAGSNLAQLTAALRGRNIQVVGPEQLTLGRNFEENLADILSNVDLVIGVLTRERRSAWALFELGQAWALGKRILLFAPPDATYLPSTLHRFITVRANLSNREAIDFALDQILAAPEPTAKTTASSKVQRPVRASANTYLQRSFPIAASVSGSQLEKLVAVALKEVGVDVLLTAPEPDRGADLAIWSDGLQPSVGNPLLVEIKSRLTSSRSAAGAGQQLARYVTASGGRWGLLLYGEGPPDLKSLPPNILALPVDLLFQRLKEESFDDIIRDLRNRRVHGVGL